MCQIQIVIIFHVKMKSAYQSKKGKKVIGCMSQVFIHATFVHVMLTASKVLYRVQHPLTYLGSVNVFMEVTHDVVVENQFLSNFIINNYF